VPAPRPQSPAPEAPTAPQAPAAAPSPDRIAAVVNDPIVQRAIELLGARVVHVEAKPASP
jgi:hypothetical protein